VVGRLFGFPRIQCSDSSPVAVRSDFADCAFPSPQDRILKYLCDPPCARLEGKEVSHTSSMGGRESPTVLYDAQLYRCTKTATIKPDCLASMRNCSRSSPGFCFFASSFCITFLLAAFLAILVDPAVTYLERLHVPRSASAGIIIIAGMLSFCFLTYGSYNRISDIVETMPQYAERSRSAFHLAVTRDSA
jgi:hypothetical protein